MNIAVSMIDGTCYGAENCGNVYLLRRRLVNNEDERQLVSYKQGPGTYSDDKLSDSIYGANLDRIVLSQYRDLAVKCYMEDGDESWGVALFGFSRGAFAVRILGALLDCIGLPMDPEDDVHYAPILRGAMESPYTYKLTKDQKRMFYRPEIVYMGLFDTVNATLKFDSKPFTNPPKCARCIRHAVAINESGKSFNYVPFRESANVEEKLFAGEHCDVGGGVNVKERALSNVALAWIANGAIAAGLKFKEPRMLSEAIDPSAVVPHDSSKDISRLLNNHYRRVFQAHNVPHDSVAALKVSPFKNGCVPLLSSEFKEMYSRV